jgi:hypothetical protein
MNDDDLELQLRAALKRKDPPLDFSRRVLAGVEPPRPKPIRAWMPIAMAATLLIGFGAVGVHRAQEARRADDAKRQLMLALEITSEKLGVVEQILDRSTH